MRVNNFERTKIISFYRPLQRSDTILSIPVQFHEYPILSNRKSITGTVRN